jgi:hypothetical protein
MDSLARRPRSTLLPFTNCASVTAAVALLLRPMNNDVYAFPLGVNDPQGDEQVFDMLYIDVIMRHTSGYAYGMVFALILGARLARFGPAAICGTLLGIINAGVAFAVGGSTVVSMSPERIATVSGSLRLDLLSDDGFWLAVLGGAAAFPIWAVAGAALGRLAYSGTALLVGGCVSRRRCAPGSSSGAAPGSPARSWRSCCGHRPAAPASLRRSPCTTTRPWRRQRSSEEVCSTRSPGICSLDTGSRRSARTPFGHSIDDQSGIEAQDHTTVATDFGRSIDDLRWDVLADCEQNLNRATPALASRRPGRGRTCRIATKCSPPSGRRCPHKAQAGQASNIEGPCHANLYQGPSAERGLHTCRGRMPSAHGRDSVIRISGCHGDL